MNPVQEVCIRPRKVFGALAATPVGITDYALSAAQGIAMALFWSRMKDLGMKMELSEILMLGVGQGALSGIVVTWLQSWLYTWLGRQAGGTARQPQVMHVLAYSGAPLLITLAVTCLAIPILGIEAFVVRPKDPELFVILLGTLQGAAFLIPALWSVILQVMGLSEVHQVRFRGALGTWLLGQVLLAALSLLYLLATGMPLPQG